MPKGYWVVRADVADLDQYKKYVAANAKPFKEFGAHFLARGGRFETAEGGSRSRNVIIEFPSYEDAQACWKSPGYQEAMTFRKGVATVDIVILEGYEGQQP